VYSILVSILIGAAVGTAYTLLGFWKTWAMGSILGFLVAILSLVIISRILARRIEPRFLHAQKQIQSGANPLAIKTLEELLEFAPWQIMLKGQVHGQIGLLTYAMEKEDQALQHLEKSSVRVPDAQIALAAIRFRRKEYDACNEIMDVVVKGNKKQLFLYHVQAFLLSRQGKKDEAIEVMQRCVKREPSNDDAKDNLLRLQNNKKMNMKRFGVQWFGLKLEKPPASMRQYPPGMRKGFRQKQKKQKGR
jgi:tetratricopeptide (TPR) repeat protein